MVYQTNSRQDTLIKSKGKFVDESEQTVISSIKMFGANIEHSARNNYRPYLMMYGEISAVAFPNGRYQAFYPPTQVHVRYEFSDDELGQLSTKGLFYDGFKCPDIISENPNIEIPMVATARRYELMGNLYVSLDLASKGIYQTNTKASEYIFANYFEEQIPSQLDTKPVKKEEDVIPTFDDDFAAQFAAEFEQAGLEDKHIDKNDEFSKESAQARHRQALITKEANDLLLKSPTYMREQSRAKSIADGKVVSNVKSPEIAKAEAEVANFMIDNDDEFATFRRAQKDHVAENTAKSIVQPFNINKIHDANAKDNDPILNNEMDASLDGDFGDAFDGELDHIFSKTEDKPETEDTHIDEKEPQLNTDDKVNYDLDSELEESDDKSQLKETKESVEEALKNATSTKHNSNSQRFTVPDDEAQPLSDGRNFDSV